MKRILHISIVLIFAFGVSSCAKEELDAPSHTPKPQAIMKSGVENADQEGKDYDLDKAAPLFINDDGDVEDEGLKPVLTTENKK